ncbi:hypothetical protein EBT31_02030 [bacterium]|jgi:hypothetical protein|nr:hypothetical protein [bacterium]
MFRFAFKLSNPFSNRFEVIYSAGGKTPNPTKFWEIGLYKTNKILGVNFSYTIREDHAGIWLELDLLGYGAELRLYDFRHWDYENKCWHTYGVLD